MWQARGQACTHKPCNPTVELNDPTTQQLATFFVTLWAPAATWPTSQPIRSGMDNITWLESWNDNSDKLPWAMESLWRMSKNSTNQPDGFKKMLQSRVSFLQEHLGLVFACFFFLMWFSTHSSPPLISKICFKCFSGWAFCVGERVVFLFKLALKIGKRSDPIQSGVSHKNRSYENVSILKVCFSDGKLLSTGG